MDHPKMDLHVRIFRDSFRDQRAALVADPRTTDNPHKRRLLDRLQRLDDRLTAKLA